MPSKSESQAKFMSANCKSANLRKKTKIPKKVACDFHDSDKGIWHENVFDGLAKQLCEDFHVDYEEQCDFKND